MPDELLAWSARTEATDRPLDVVKARLATALGTRYVRGLDEQRIRDAMGIDWTRDEFELREALPPAYCEFIGNQLIQQLTERAA